MWKVSFQTNHYLRVNYGKFLWHTFIWHTRFCDTHFFDAHVYVTLTFLIHTRFCDTHIFVTLTFLLHSRFCDTRFCKTRLCDTCFMTTRFMTHNFCDTQRFGKYVLCHTRFITHFFCDTQLLWLAFMWHTCFCDTLFYAHVYVTHTFMWLTHFLWHMFLTHMFMWLTHLLWHMFCDPHVFVTYIFMPRVSMTHTFVWNTRFMTRVLWYTCLSHTRFSCRYPSPCSPLHSSFFCQQIKATFSGVQFYARMSDPAVSLTLPPVQLEKSTSPAGGGAHAALQTAVVLALQLSVGNNTAHCIVFLWLAPLFSAVSDWVTFRLPCLLVFHEYDGAWILLTVCVCVLCVGVCACV